MKKNISVFFSVFCLFYVLIFGFITLTNLWGVIFDPSREEVHRDLKTEATRMIQMKDFTTEYKYHIEYDNFTKELQMILHEDNTSIIIRVHNMGTEAEKIIDQGPHNYGASYKKRIILGSLVINCLFSLWITAGLWHVRKTTR